MPDDADLAFAQRVIVEDARTLGRDLTAQNLPARVDSLPFAKAAILNAIETSVTFLSSTSILTDELREYFETAYVSLAEYLEPELAALVLQRRPRAALAAQAGESRLPGGCAETWNRTVRGLRT
jgi:hypothetical protein